MPIVHLAWDIIHGTTDSTLPSALQLTIHPPTPPPQAPTLQPDSTFREYIHRLITTTAVSQSVVVVALFYLYKARAHLQRLLIMGDVVDRTMAHGICAASLMLGNKFLDDNTYTSRTWATLSGYTLWEINDCERKLLQSLDFQLNITPQDYNNWWGFLSAYTPSGTGFINHARAVKSPPSRPLTAEAWASIMPVNRRIARVASRPTSRKRSRADDQVEMPNKRSVVSMPCQHPPWPTSQAMAYPSLNGLPSGQPLSTATIQEQLPLQVVPFAFGDGFVQVSRGLIWCLRTIVDASTLLNQNLPLEYCTLVASPVDPQANDHYRKTQLVNPSQQQMYMPQLQYTSAPYASVIYSDSARRASAPSMENSAPLPVIDRSITSNTYGDHLSLGDSQFVLSRKMPYMGSQNIDHLALGQQQFSVHPETVINFGYLEGVYPPHFG